MSTLSIPAPDLFRLDGKVALVIGSASGLDAAIAVALAQAGAAVTTHGNRRAADETSSRMRPAIGRSSNASRPDAGVNRKISPALHSFSPPLPRTT